MSDLRCARCGTEASYADAQIADLRGTCPEARPSTSTDHAWTEVDA